MVRYFLRKWTAVTIPKGNRQTVSMRRCGESAQYGCVAGWRAGAAALSVLAGLAGCATNKDPSVAVVTVPDTFSVSGDTPLSDRWWTAFNDEGLERQISAALASNLTLGTAWERLREARATAGGASAERFPELTGSAGAERVEPNDDGDTRLELGLAATYELDLWGGIRSAAEAERLRADAAAEAVQTAAITLTAEIAQTWYALQEAHAQLDLLRAQEQTNADILTVLKKRFSQGQSRRVDVLRQEQLVEATRQQRIAGELNRSVLEHQLAVLTGNAPGQGMAYEPIGLPELPPLPDAGIPLALVQRRPDIQAAYLELRAADRDVATAVSLKFPRISLSASATTVEEGAERLMDDWVRTLAANIVAPLLDAGRREAEVEQARAREQQRLYEYGQHVLTAFREVEDALVQEAKQRDILRALDVQVTLAEQSYDQLRTEYMNGAGTYMDVLTVLTDTQTLRRERLAAERRLVDIRISLYRALAGGIPEMRKENS